MKANELRVNNLVEHNGIVQTVISVCDTDSGEADCCLSVSGNGVGDLKPIPLTEEWLVKFGFIYDGYDYQCWDKVERRVFESQSYFGDFIEYDGYYLPKPYYFAEAFGEDFKLKYVHQLQNLYFALTGEELLIK